MIYRILRYVIAILVGTAAYVGMDSLAPIIDPYLVSQFESFGDMSLTIARISVLIFGTLLGVIMGYLISSFILKQGLVISKRLERILELCNTGFIEGPLMVPLFVLNELQIISDSADATKRNRGRRGLDILKEMQDANKVAIEVVEDDYDDLTEVDSKLMRLALDKQWKLMTNDFNLNKVARVQGIEVLNLNELANVLKPALIAGEWIRVQIMKEGKEVHQGVAYLDDGTMIVVEDGKPYVGQTVEVMVTSILQTSAGRMIFARVDGGQNGQGN